MEPLSCTSEVGTTRLASAEIGRHTPIPVRNLCVTFQTRIHVYQGSVHVPVNIQTPLLTLHCSTRLTDCLDIADTA